MVTLSNPAPAWTVLAAAGTVQSAASTTDGKQVYLFTSTGANASSMLAWNRVNQTWLQQSPVSDLRALGLPAGGVQVYQSAVALNGVLWVALYDKDGATRVFFRAPSRAQLLGDYDPAPPIFVEAPTLGCGALPALSGLVALGSSALGFTATALYGWSAAAGCLGSLPLASLPGFAASSLAPTALQVTATSYTVTTVLLATLPAGCAAGVSGCAGASPVYAAAAATDGAAALLSAGSWTPVTPPGGASMGVLQLSVPTGSIYGASTACTAAASFPSCACGVAGYPLLKASVSGVDWAYAGCVPLLPTSLMVPRDRLIYAAGVTVATPASAGTAAVVASADGGATWLTIANVPAQTAGACSLATGGLSLNELGLRGGPALFSGMDPSAHGDINSSPTACGAFTATPRSIVYPTCMPAEPNSQCPTWRFVMSGIRLIRSGATVPASTDVAVLGVDPSSAAVSAFSGKAANTLPGGAGAVWQAVCNLGYSATYWFGQSTSGRTIPAFFAALAVGNVTPAMIYVTDARSNWPITPADQIILSAYGAELGAFVTRGGGFFSNTQLSVIDSQAHYEFIDAMAPFISLQPTGNPSLMTPSLTGVGAENFPELVSGLVINPNIEGPWHQFFAGPTGVMDVLAVQLQQNFAVDTYGTTIFAVNTNSPRGTYLDAYGSPVAVLVGGISVEFPTGTQPQAITCPGSYSVNYGTPITLACTANSTLPVTYSSNSSACVTDQYTVATLAPAVCLITVKQPGNDLFAGAYPVTFYIFVSAGSPTASPSQSASVSGSASASASPTWTASRTPSPSASSSASPTAGLSRTSTLSTSPSPTLSASRTASATATASVAASPSVSATVLASRSTSPSRSATKTASSAESSSNTPSASASATVTPTTGLSLTSTPSVTRSASMSATLSFSATSSHTASESTTISSSPSESNTQSSTGSAS